MSDTSSDGFTNKEADHLATALGAPLFTTALHMPAYREGIVGRWKLTRTGLCFDRGYHSGLWTVFGMPVLMRAGDRDGTGWETWMSLTPHEIESQELGCRYAVGHTVVMGLGMGWVAVNIALNPVVNRVTIIERDPEVIELFYRSQAMAGLPDAIVDKIRIVQGDALVWIPDEKVDFLYADIWLCLEEPQALDDVRRMQDNLCASVIYFWGQELLIHALANKRPEECSEADWAESVHRCITETIELPLLSPDDFDYPRLIADVTRRRRERRRSGLDKGET